MSFMLDKGLDLSRAWIAGSAPSYGGDGPTGALSFNPGTVTGSIALSEGNTVAQKTGPNEGAWDAVAWAGGLEFEGKKYCAIELGPWDGNPTVWSLAMPSLGHFNDEGSVTGFANTWTAPSFSFHTYLNYVYTPHIGNLPSSSYTTLHYNGSIMEILADFDAGRLVSKHEGQVTHDLALPADDYIIAVAFRGMNLTATIRNDIQAATGYTWFS